VTLAADRKDRDVPAIADWFKLPTPCDGVYISALAVMLARVLGECRPGGYAAGDQFLPF